LWNVYKIRVLLGILGALKTKLGSLFFAPQKRILCCPQEELVHYALPDPLQVYTHSIFFNVWERDTEVTWGPDIIPVTWGGLCFRFYHLFTTTAARVPTVLSASWCAALIEREALTT
jgi:hypothetical protein